MTAPPVPFLPATLQEWMSLLQSTVTTVAVGFTAWAGVRGLNTWRWQLYGTVDLDVARKLLLALFRIREELMQMFVPLINSTDAEEAERRAKEVSSSSMDRELWAVLWKKVEDTLPEYNVAVAEAIALWGDEVKPASEKFARTVHDFGVDLNMVQSLGVNDPQRPEFYKKALGDESKQRLFGAITSMEECVRTKMRHGK